MSETLPPTIAHTSLTLLLVLRPEWQSNPCRFIGARERVGVRRGRR